MYLRTLATIVVVGIVIGLLATGLWWLVIGGGSLPVGLIGFVGGVAVVYAFAWTMIGHEPLLRRNCNCRLGGSH